MFYGTTAVQSHGFRMMQKPMIPKMVLAAVLATMPVKTRVKTLVKPVVPVLEPAMENPKVEKAAVKADQEAPEVRAAEVTVLELVTDLAAPGVPTTIPAQAPVEVRTMAQWATGMETIKIWLHPVPAVRI